MTRTRVFYGHGAPVPPTGLRAREAAPAAAADATAESVEVVEVVTENAAATVDEAVVNDLADDAPDGSWSHAEIDAYAEAHGISLDGAKKKSEKLALIEYALEGD